MNLKCTLLRIGVGKATTLAVVAGSVAVIAVDFFVTRLLISMLFGI